MHKNREIRADSYPEIPHTTILTAVKNSYTYSGHEVKITSEQETLNFYK